jgi:rhodanese-related sulfurtransferase
MPVTRLRALAAAVVAALALVGAGCGGGTSSATSQETETAASAATLLSPDEANARIESGDVEILDVRTPEEYAQGHVEGATLIDFYEPDFADRIAELDRDTEYVVYCRSGNRSGQATAMMTEQGFSAVNDVDGGIVAWEAAGLPVTR